MVGGRNSCPMNEDIVFTYTKSPPNNFKKLGAVKLTETYQHKGNVE